MHTSKHIFYDIFYLSYWIVLMLLNNDQYLKEGAEGRDQEAEIETGIMEEQCLLAFLSCFLINLWGTSHDPELTV